MNLPSLQSRRHIPQACALALCLWMVTTLGYAQDSFTLSDFGTGPQLTAMSGGEYSTPELGFTTESDPLTGGDFTAGFIIDSIPPEPPPATAPGGVVLAFEWNNGRLTVTVPETRIPGVMEFAANPAASSEWKAVTEVPVNGRYEFTTAGALRFFRWRSLQ